MSTRSPACEADAAPRLRPLRLAIVRQHYKADGGAERFTASLLSALGGQHHELTVVSRNWQQQDGVHAMRCNPPRLGRLSRDLGFVLAVGQQLKSMRFDLVQSNERVPGCDVYRAGDGVHRQWLVHRRRTQSWPARWLSRLSLYHAYLQWIERRVFEHPRLKAVICNSQMVRDEVLRYFRVDPAKLHVIYNSVDTQRFSPELKQHRAAVRRQWSIPQDAPLFVFVGSGFQRKGLRYAIESLRHLPEAHLLVVGGDKQSQQYVRLAQQRGVASRTHFAGVRNDVGPCYGAADALVLPTLYDPMPNVTLEAMAAGLPILVSPACGAAELIRNEDCGLVCDPLDSQALIGALQRLANPQTATTMGEAARRRVAALTPEAMAGQLTELYRTILT
jgi:UDP-glucose:(heptosyl)LPS alpha-1,3-glucosyltransferase